MQQWSYARSRIEWERHTHTQHTLRARKKEKERERERERERRKNCVWRKLQRRSCKPSDPPLFSHPFTGHTSTLSPLFSYIRTHTHLLSLFPSRNWEKRRSESIPRARISLSRKLPVKSLPHRPNQPLSTWSVIGEGKTASLYTLSFNHICGRRKERF